MYPVKKHYQSARQGPPGPIGPAGNEYSFLSYRFSGLDYSNQIVQLAPGTQALTANTLRTFPLVVTQQLTISQFRVQVSTLVAATSFRIGIYTSNNGYPNALIAGSDSLFDGAITTVQVATFPTAITLAPGLYWIAVIANGAPTLRAVPVGAVPNVLGLNPAMGTNSQYTGRTVNLTFQSLPLTHPGGATLLANLQPPLVLMRVV